MTNRSERQASRGFIPVDLWLWLKGESEEEPMGLKLIEYKCTGAACNWSSTAPSLHEAYAEYVNHRAEQHDRSARATLEPVYQQVPLCRLWKESSFDKKR